MVDCLSPKGDSPTGNWERFVCASKEGEGLAPSSTGVAVAEFARSRYFARDAFILHRGVNVYRPRWGIEPVQTLYKKEGYVNKYAGAEGASGRGIGYLPEPHLRTIAFFGIRGLGALVDLYSLVSPIARIVEGDSEVEGTMPTDLLAASQSTIGLFTVFYPTRLGRGVAAHASLLLGALGAASLGESAYHNITLRSSDDRRTREQLGRLALTALHYALGMGGRLTSHGDPVTGQLQKGRYVQLEGDLGRAVSIRKERREGAFGLARVELVEAGLVRYHPRVLNYTSPDGGPLLVKDLTFIGYTHGDGGQLVSVGQFEVHQPVEVISSGGRATYRDVGLPDITLRIAPNHQGNGNARRFRYSLLNFRLPADHALHPLVPESPLRRGWTSRVMSMSELFGEGGEAYQRSLEGSPVRLAAARGTWMWEPEHGTGKPVRFVQGVMVVRPDHRVIHGFWRGTFKNLRETVRGHRFIENQIQRGKLHRGLPDHPQVTTPLLLRQRRAALLAEQVAREAEWGFIKPGPLDVSWLSDVPSHFRVRPTDSPRAYWRGVRRSQSGPKKP
ncbi:MAG: hypothetical protein Q7S98_02255 [Deltaproteobacteria bacterium]|nr:hypothetical protein [Deltaproteobacteria bacterium]